MFYISIIKFIYPGSPAISVKPDLLNIDLAALRTLRLVYRLGSFSEAAHAIEVKQPTVSYTIDRLRKALNDPLFVRQGGRIAPTDRCRQIMETVERILSEAENLEEPDGFDPARSGADVTITCSTLAAQTIIPGVLGRLRSGAPGIRLNIVMGYHDVRDMLLDGKADIALVAGEVEASGIYAHMGLLNDRPVCLMDPGNPLAGKTISEQDLTDAKHLQANPWPNWKPAYMQVAERRGIRINTAATVTDPEAIGFLIPGTDLISGLPSRIARSYEGRLAFARFPFDVNVRLHMYWTAAAHRSKLNSWLRRIIVEEAERQGPVPEL